MSIFTQAKRKLAEAAVFWAKKGLGFKTVPFEVAKQRLERCQACPKYNKETDQCTICTCFMEIKTQLQKDPFEVVKKMTTTAPMVVCPNKETPLWGAYIDSENTGL